MFGSATLEVAIGVILVFLLVAIVTSALREGIESILRTRAAYLARGIRELLHDKGAVGLANDFFRHPLIYSLFPEEYDPKDTAGGVTGKPPLFAVGRNYPSYIPAKNFALALMDIAARGPVTDAFSTQAASPAISIETIRANIRNVGNEAVQRVLLTAIDNAQNDITKAQANIEAWYDSAMDRVSGWYKRSTSWVLFWLGLAVAIGANVNTITIADYLYRNDAARAAVVQRAEAISRDATFPDSVSYARARVLLDSLRLPIGWGEAARLRPPGYTPGEELGLWYGGLAPALGWLMTALAAALGAPFWFDLLNKVMVIRSTVKPTEKSPEEGSEDRKKNEKPAAPPGGQGARDEGGERPAQPPGPARAPEPAPVLTAAADIEAFDDACDVEIDHFTADEDLPESIGGVA